MLKQRVVLIATGAAAMLGRVLGPSLRTRASIRLGSAVPGGSGREVTNPPEGHELNVSVRAALVARARALTGGIIRPDLSTSGPSRWSVQGLRHIGYKRDSTVKQLHRFALDESGAEIIEYAVVTVILLLSTGLILSQIYDTVLDVMIGILEELTQ